MSTNPVTYDEVRAACCFLLGKGEGPSRPRVQDVLAEENGRKGSNSVVQGFINQFWAEAAERMNMPSRQVADVPEAFVPVIDRALLEMVAISRKMAAEEFTEREAALAAQMKDSEARVQLANDTAAASEQLRLRAEGELNGMQSVVVELRASVRSLEDRLADEAKKGAGLQQNIAEKDAELAKQFSALATAGQKLEQATETHRQEANRLLRQVDDERQTAKRDGEALRRQIEMARSESDAVRRELSEQRQETARLKAENEAKNTTIASQSANIEGLSAKVEAAEVSLREAQRDVTILQVKLETANNSLRGMEEQCADRTEELGALKLTVAKLENEKYRLVEKENQTKKQDM